MPWFASRISGSETLGLNISLHLQSKISFRCSSQTVDSERLICEAYIRSVLIRMVQRTFTVRLKRDQESGYYATRCVELPEVISQGKTEEEALTNLKEALELVLEEYESQAKKEGDKLIPIVV